jgi:chaperonin cofactor prefoldin|tara:strand:+ start:553 stop:732 length:180 start_codon:yes stop_codon:yes gene_type:complete
MAPKNLNARIDKLEEKLKSLELKIEDLSTKIDEELDADLFEEFKDELQNMKDFMGYQGE